MEVPDGQKRRRTVRYIHLNPCRDHLVDDPLAWPLSTHLDAVGLVARPRVRRVSDPVGFHAYVSGDPHASVAGTDLPWGTEGALEAGAIMDAVSVVTRTPLSRIARRGPGRDLAVHALRALTPATQKDIAVVVGIGVRTMRRLPVQHPPELRLVVRLAGDRRVTPLDDSVLRRILQRGRYRWCEP